MRVMASSEGRIIRLVSGVLRGGRLADAPASLGVTVSERRLSGDLLGLTIPPSLVVLHSDLRGDARDSVLSHELGHVLVAQGRCPWVTAVTEEAFCDDFAAAMMEAETSARRSFGGRPAQRLAG